MKYYTMKTLETYERRIRKLDIKDYNNIEEIKNELNKITSGETSKTKLFCYSCSYSS